jgi:hypothetical protein
VKILLSWLDWRFYRVFFVNFSSKSLSTCGVRIKRINKKRKPVYALSAYYSSRNEKTIVSFIKTTYCVLLVDSFANRFKFFPPHLSRLKTFGIFNAISRFKRFFIEKTLNDVLSLYTLIDLCRKFYY